MSSRAYYQYSDAGSRKQSRTEAAVQSIEELIRLNGWKDGEKLPSQRSLADELGFSRPTIREALVSMETKGRLIIQPAKGVFVTEEPSAPAPDNHPGIQLLTTSALSGRESQMYQFRYAIEPAIARLVAINATPAQIEDLSVVVGTMRQSVEEKDHTEFARLDFAFHSQMIEAANNRFFTESISPFLGLFFESQKLPFAHDGNVIDTVSEHEAIMKHLKNKKADGAQRAMEEHIKGVARRAEVKLVI
ncbi:FadR/GntR family transcriptional regulator [Maridesulfovibrio bastinii]|uniref:FadR/GntR family transcriptional regulator n=1 Tax=Maridesulfovibrio bastinii TaxID=47157 RepID=UPI00041E427E|nr:FadR/GntR family transcriptional regulator [Maridesulfovibrio bastinii]